MALQNIRKYLVFYPLLFFYSRNEWLFPAQDLLYALAIIFAAASIMFGLLALILRNVHVAAIATSAVFLAFFSSEAILGQTQGFIKPRYAIVIYALLVCAALYFILRYTNDKIRFSFILNAVAVFRIKENRIL